MIIKDNQHRFIFEIDNSFKKVNKNEYEVLKEDRHAFHVFEKEINGANVLVILSCYYRASSISEYQENINKSIDYYNSLSNSGVKVLSIDEINNNRLVNKIVISFNDSDILNSYYTLVNGYIISTTINVSEFSELDNDVYNLFDSIEEY